MSEVKKIQIDGVSYDLGGGSGLSDDAKNALLDCLAHVAWIDEDGQQYVDALEAALFDNTWSVTNTLTNATTSNPSATVTKDGIYSATISAAAGYTLEGATVSVTMNGADITSSVYDDGDILIPAVTGDVVITVVAVALTVVSISAVYTQSGAVYSTDTLDSLKADLVVTATMSDSSAQTIPSTDYTLSGSLTNGTSTITVTYGGFTTTFSVNVTAYTWLYNASDGQTLSQRTDIVTKAITAGSITETLSNGELHLVAAKGNNGCKWDFTQTTNNNAMLRIKFKVASSGLFSDIGGFQAQLSNGTGGVKTGTTKESSSSSNVKLQTMVGNTGAVSHNITTGEWHLLELILNNSKQTVILDGATLENQSNICTYYNTYNRIFVQCNNAQSSDATDLYIDFIGYINNDL